MLLNKSITNKVQTDTPNKSKSDHKLKNVIVEGEYHLEQGRFLGEGSFGICYLYTDIKTNVEYCLKVIPKSKLEARELIMLKNEVKIQRSLNHKGVVKLYHTFNDEDYFYLLLELVEGGTLKDVLLRREKLTEPEVRYYIYQVLDILNYIHQQGYIHRDFKLGNLFLTKDCQIKIGDFSHSAEITPDKKDRTTMCGTPSYIAPELLMKTGYGPEVDIWSLGVVIFLCLFGVKPFNTMQKRKLFAMIVAADYNLPETEEVSDHARDFIKCLLQVDPAARSSIKALSSHSFLDKRTIPKFLDPIALTSNPGLVLRTFDDETESTSKRQRNNTSEVKRKSFLKYRIPPLELEFNASTKIKEASDVIVKEFRKLVEKPETVTAHMNDDKVRSPKFICRMDQVGSPTPFQMYDGTLGVRYNNQLNLITRPNLPLLLAYEKVKGTTDKYNCSYHNYDSFCKQHPKIFNELTELLKSLEVVNGICNTNKTATLDDYQVESLPTATFPLCIQQMSKSTVFVLSDSTLQIQFTYNTSLVFETKAKRITLIQNKVVRTFGLQDFLIFGLKSGITFHNTLLADLVDFSKLDTASLPEGNKNQFKGLNIHYFFYYFNQFFNTIQSHLDRKSRQNSLKRVRY